MFVDNQWLSPGHHVYPLSPGAVGQLQAGEADDGGQD